MSHVIPIIIINKIDDRDCNEYITFVQTPSAVNHFQITNAATNDHPVLAAEGDDVNVNISLQPKGDGVCEIAGTSSSSAEIRLNEDTDNGTHYVGMKAPSSLFASQTYTLPVSDGSFNEVLTTDGIGNLSFKPVVQFYPLVAVIEDRKSVGTNGGTFTEDIWLTRTLNTITGNAAPFVSLSSDQFTLQPGEYFINIDAPAYRVDQHQCRLYNVTDDVVTNYGTSSFSNRTPQGSSTSSMLKIYINLFTAKTYRVEHRCTRKRNNDGFGISAGFAGATEVYTVVTVMLILD